MTATTEHAIQVSFEFFPPADAPVAAGPALMTNAEGAAQRR